MPMIRIPIELEYEFTGADGEDVDKIVTQMIEESFDLTPMTVEVTCPHGVFMEYGTNPAKKGSGTKIPGQPTAVQLKFRQWAAAKCKARAATMKMSTDRYGDMIYHKIMSEGLKEHPFFRPAIYEVMDDIDAYFTEGGRGTKGIAEDIVTSAKNNLILDNSIYTGDLMNSISCRELTEDIPDGPPTEDEMEIWDAIASRVHGKDGEK